MYSPFRFALRYARYYWSSSNGKGHGIHSPFVYTFVREVLNDPTIYPQYAQIESIRKRLNADATPVPREDYGARHQMPERTEPLGRIAKRSSKPTKYAQLLFRIARHYRPQYMVELGTSVGISGAYLAAADPAAILYTAEGNHALASVARKTFDALGLMHVQVITGNFDNTLPSILETLPQLDLAFIDGNHRAGPTTEYFDQLAAKVSDCGCIIVDDIHWSADMEKAWAAIKKHPSVMLTIDLFMFGVVFFRPAFKIRQHFSIRF